MFYGTSDNVESPYTLRLGFIVITVQELFVSVISVAIVFPPSLLIVQIFRNVNVRQKQINKRKLLNDENTSYKQKELRWKVSLRKRSKVQPGEDVPQEKTMGSAVFSDAASSKADETGSTVRRRYSSEVTERTVRWTVGSSSDCDSVGSRKGTRYTQEGRGVVEHKEPGKNDWEKGTHSLDRDLDYWEESDYEEEYESEYEFSEESEVEDDSVISESDEEDEKYGNNHDDLWSDDSTDVSVSDSDDSDDEAPSQPKKKGLPAGCLYVAWTIAVLSIITPAFFVILYSMSWGPEISNAWLVSYILSFLESVLITDPMKVKLYNINSTC